MIHQNLFVSLLSLDVLISISPPPRQKKASLLHDVFSFLENYCGALIVWWQE